MRRSLALSTIAITLACGDSPTSPQAGLLGDYELTQLDSDIRGVTTDHLAAGARINLELLGGGNALVDLFVPGAREDGTDLVEVVNTTWSTQRQALTTTIVVTTLWIDANSAIVSSGWRIQDQQLFTNPPSCSLEWWDPSIADCRIDAELTKVLAVP